jgi:hypothetical protein
MGATGHDEVSHPTWRRAIAATLGAMALLAAGACSSGDDEATGDDEDVDGVPLEDGAEAPASDVEAVTGYVEDLLTGYEDAVNAILLDQQVTLDESSPEVTAYRDLFAPDSEAVAEAMEGWQANAEAGVQYRPTDPSQPAIRSWLDGDLEVVSDDEVTFPTCDVHRMETLDGQGQVVETIEVLGLAGEGVAVRVGGRWYLRDLELLADAPPCDDDGGSDGDDTGGDDSSDETDETEGP